MSLPLDIWTEILGFLSLKCLLKTCILNRLFLDLSLQFLYQEIFLLSSDPQIYQTFQSIIRDQLIANRVRRILISSRFPPEHGFNPFGSNSIQKFNSRLVRLEELRRRIITDGSQVLARTEPPGTFVLPNLLEFSITLAKGNLKDLTNFQMLLCEKHIGECLRGLKVTAGTLDTILLLFPMVWVNPNRRRDGMSDVSRKRQPRTSITHLSIDFVQDDTAGVIKYSSLLLESLASNLSSFSFSYSAYPTASHGLFNPGLLPLSDISNFLKTLPYLPASKEIRFQAPFKSKTMENPGLLTEWLKLYQGQLERLTIRGTTWPEYSSDDDSESESESVEEGPGDIYSLWLGSVDQSHYSGFSSLTFPKLHSLEIRAGFWPLTGKVLPPLRMVTPSLRSLTLGYDDWFDPKEICRVVTNIPTREGYCGLETLRFCCTSLNLELLDFLHESLPQLRELELNCRLLMTPQDVEVLLTRKYFWHLSYLRITVSSLCRVLSGKHLRPDLDLMRAIAHCLECDPILDTKFDCDCEYQEREPMTKSIISE